MMRRNKRPSSDPSSIGRLLQSLGVKRSELNTAVAHQKRHPNRLLGEICVELGFVHADRLAIALTQQRAIRKRSVGDLVELATKHTRKMTRDTAAMVEVSTDALCKLHDHDHHD